MIKTKEEKQATHDKQEAEYEKKFKRLRTSFIKIAELPEGLDIFRFIMEECGYQKNNIVFNPETREINTNASHYLEARRSVYLQLRTYIPAKHLKKIEFK